MERILKIGEVTAMTGLSKASVYGRADFPKPIKLSNSGRSSGWLASEVSAWIQSRVDFTRNKASNTTRGARP